MIPGPKVKISIRKLTSSSDGKGSQIEHYDTERSAPLAGWHSLTAGERLIAQKETGVIDNRVFVPYDSTIHLTDRVYYNGVWYEIVAIVNPAQSKHHQELDVRRLE